MNPDTSILFEPVGLLTALVVVLGFSVVIVRLGIMLATRTGFVAKPNPIVLSHTRPVAFGGGIAVILVSIFISGLLIPDDRMAALLAPVALSLIVGIVDDVMNLKPLAKLAGQIIPVGLYLVLTQPPLWAAGLIALFLIASQNAWNFVDVMDGLVGSVAVVVFLGLAAIIVLGRSFDHHLAILSVVITGATLGFLVWNRHPAKIYMGDSGSLPLGLIYGIAVAELFSRDFQHGSSALLLGAVPLFELIFLIVVRWKKGIPVYRGSSDHFSMRMQCAGTPVTAILKRVLAVNVAIAIIASMLVLVPAQLAIPALVVAGLIVFAACVIAWKYVYSLPVWGED